MRKVHARLSSRALLACLLAAGCSSSRPPYSPERPPEAPPPPVVVNRDPPAPSARTEYEYRAVTDDCNCAEFRTGNAGSGVEFIFRARYKMDGGVVTTLDLEVRNTSADTVFFDHGTVRVSSKNIAYQYNDKFLPLGDLIVPPGDARGIQLTGKDINDANDWHKIAGERLTVTVRGIRAGEKTLKQQSVTFVPENPMIGK